jgi:hypothetical protein
MRAHLSTKFKCLVLKKNVYIEMILIFCLFIQSIPSTLYQTTVIENTIFM